MSRKEKYALVEPSTCLLRQRHQNVWLLQMPLWNRHQHLFMQRRWKKMRRIDPKLVIISCWMRACLHMYHMETRFMELLLNHMFMQNPHMDLMLMEIPLKIHVHVNMF